MNNTAEKIKDFIYSALFAALTIALGFVSIPIGPVPISGMSLGIMLAGSVLTAKQAMYSALTIILLGAIGLPVFSGFTGGLGILFGPRGGYYVGFLFGTGVIAFLRGKETNVVRFFLANTIGGILVVYAFAIPWLAFVTDMNMQQALYAGALPFIIGDLLKATVASMLAVVLTKHATVFRGKNA